MPSVPLTKASPIGSDDVVTRYIPLLVRDYAPYIIRLVAHFSFLIHSESLSPD